MTQGNKNCGFDVSRRVVVGAALASVPLLAARSRADEETDPTAMLPQVGDHFVYLAGPMQGQPVKTADLVLGGPQIQAYPADAGGRVRDGSRLNLIILARIDAAGASPETLANAADGVVAYSGVCTHQGCPVNMWLAEKSAFYCSCHGSTYSPKDGAEVVAGPAPRALPALPLKEVDGLLVVAAGFTGPVGVVQN